MPPTVVLLIVNMLFSFKVLHGFSPGAQFVVSHACKLFTFYPLLWRFRHITRGMAQLSPHASYDIDRIATVDFVWVNRSLGAEAWLAEDLARLEAADEHDIFSFSLYCTRPPKNVLPSTAPAAVPTLRRGILHGRPDWQQVLARTARRVPPGAVVGVFFCGAPALGAVLAQVGRGGGGRCVGAFVFHCVVLCCFCMVGTVAALPVCKRKHGGAVSVPLRKLLKRPSQPNTSPYCSFTQPHGSALHAVYADMRKAPSTRMVSPLMYGLSMMDWTRCA